MGAWGYRAFDNDAANDWAYDLDDVDDLSLVESAFRDLDEVGDDYLDSDLACNALAACEVLARLLGNPGYTDAYTEKVDAWVAKHRLEPSATQLKRADEAINRILGDNSELRQLWEEGDVAAWVREVDDLRARLKPRV